MKRGLKKRENRGERRKKKEERRKKKEEKREKDRKPKLISLSVVEVKRETDTSASFSTTSIIIFVGGLFCFVLFCFVLFCFVLFCFVLFWLLFLFLKVKKKKKKKKKKKEKKKERKGQNYSKTKGGQNILSSSNPKHFPLPFFQTTKT